MIVRDIATVEGRHAQRSAHRPQVQQPRFAASCLELADSIGKALLLELDSHRLARRPCATETALHGRNEVGAMRAPYGDDIEVCCIVDLQMLRQHGTLFACERGRRCGKQKDK